MSGVILLIGFGLGFGACLFCVIIDRVLHATDSYDWDEEE